MLHGAVLVHDVYMHTFIATISEALAEASTFRKEITYQKCTI